MPKLPYHAIRALERLEDRSVPAIFDVTNLFDSGVGSLRQAILDANSEPGADTIAFQVSGVISLATALPDITDTVNLDGSTAPGYAGAPVITVDATSQTGLNLAAGSAGSTVQALALLNSSAMGLTLNDDNITMLGNVVQANANGGILITASSTGNSIGSVESPNRIASNSGPGLTIDGSSGNVIRANLIGTSADGLAAAPNGGPGILLMNGATDNTIGGKLSGNPPGTTPPDFSGARPPEGNLISGNLGDGVRITGGSASNRLFGNFIGTDATGIAPLGNQNDGIAIENSDGNLVAGTIATLDPFIYYNVVGGNGGNGLRVTDSNFTTIQANFFGMGSNDETPVGNGANGVVIEGTSSNTLFGGPIPLGNVVVGNGNHGVLLQGAVSEFLASNNFTGVGAFVDFTNLGNAVDGWHITATGGNIILQVGNIISRNGDDGVEISGDARGVQVVQNIIGLNTDGFSPMPNGGHGIEIGGTASAITVGGIQTDFSIVPTGTISANGGYGIVVEGEARNIAINFSHIGTNSAGAAELAGPNTLGNQLGGIYLGPDTSNVTIGSTDPDLPTIVSGNLGNGITIDGSSNHSVIATRIGVGQHGGAVPNTGAGIAIVDGGGNRIGGTGAGEGNIIAHNGGPGVGVGANAADDDSTGNRVLGNSIHSNGGIGIDLASDGATLNGVNPRAFPNDGQNFPTLGAATFQGDTIVVEGSLATRRNTVYRVEFFAESTNGSQVFLGFLDVTTDPDGAATFGSSFATPAGVVAGAALTATATDLTFANTSEFAPSVALGTVADVLAVGQGEGGNGAVVLYNGDGSFRNAFQGFEGFTGAVRVATADIDGDGVEDVIVGAGPGGGPRVRVVGSQGGDLADFFAFSSAFTGGVYVAAGDVTGDGVADLIVSAGPGGGPHVKVFDGANGFVEITSFYAYGSTFPGGATVAVGEITGDGILDIVTGTGAGGPPLVNVFRGGSFTLANSFVAFDPSFVGGLYVAAANGTIAVGPNAGGGPNVRIFDVSGSNVTQTASFFAYESTFSGGVRVALSNPADPILVVGAGLGGAARVQAYDSALALTADFFAIDPSLTIGMVGGIFVG